MAMAEAAAQRATCRRRQVGCVITDLGDEFYTAPREGGLIHTVVPGRNVLAIGYNGVHAGGSNDCGATMDAPCTTCLHAEMNALTKARPQGRINLYCTLEPCLGCARYILGASVAAVYYRQEYRTHEGVALLRDHHVLVERI